MNFPSKIFPKSKFPKVLLLAVQFSLIPLAQAGAHAGGGALDMTHAQGAVEFIAIGKPSAIKIHGKGAAPTGRFTLEKGKVSGKVSFPLESLDTGIDTRTKHMKEKYLEAQKYPDATLQITRIQLPQSLPPGDFKFENVEFEGPLTLHGKTKLVKGTATVAHAGGQMVVQAQFGLKLSDYAIDIPSFAGITVADEVKVDVHTESPWIASAGSERRTAKN